MLSLRKRAWISGGVSALVSLAVGTLLLYSFLNQRALDRFDRALAERHTQIVVALSSVAVVLRPLPVAPLGDIALLALATVAGIALGTWLARFVPARAARLAMLTIAWVGATVVLVRGILALLG